MALHIPYNQHSLHGAAVYRSYEFAPSHSASEEPLIPRPEIFDQLSKPAAQDTGLLPIRIPNVSECAVHLKLLEALYELRQKVMNSKALDAALDIKPEPRTVWRGRRGRRRQVKIQDSTFVRRREGKWPIYVKFAVLRFLHWAKKIDNALHQAKLTGEEKEIGVPPLDILLVWHSCLLNPHDFNRLSNQLNCKHIRDLEFPWAKIHNSIDSSVKFTFAEDDIRDLEALTNLQPSLYNYLTSATKSQITQAILTEWSSPQLELSQITSLFKKDSEHKLGSDAYFKECLSKTPDKRYMLTQITSAIHRQTSFVDKMHRYLWIRSPAVSGTLERAIERYSKFVKLFKLYPKHLLVPTLDIDLVWHTHQCSASRYQRDMESYTGYFINHDDKLGDSVLGGGSDKTRELYRIRFGKEYSICLCWDCEATLSAGEKFGLGLPSNKVQVKPCAEFVWALVTFYKEVERARREGKPLPAWKTRYGSEYWC